MTAPQQHWLVLRLAGPLQSWGGPSDFNRRMTADEPTKSGVLGLLAAASGLRREDSIEHLLSLQLAVRTDQPGTLLRDYHTVSRLDNGPLPSAKVDRKGIQRPTSPPKPTYVTTRFYLQDAVFVAAVGGPPQLLSALADALRRPAFPLALGRRSCPPAYPLLVPPPPARAGTALWSGDVLSVLSSVPWQARVPRGQRTCPSLPVTADAEAIAGEVAGDGGPDIRTDVPVTFDPRHRRFTTRLVRQTWVTPPLPSAGAGTHHDPFVLLDGGR